MTIPPLQIQNMEDSELIRIFLQFVQRFRLHYEKISKEISYKCHEASWIIASHKATGYGRSEGEAYKHALRNLLQTTAEDPAYRTFFADLLRPLRTFKTQAQSPQHTRQYATYSKLHQMSTKKHPYAEPKQNNSRLMHPKKEQSVHHSKICLSNQSTDQILQAKAKIKALEEQIKRVQLQNQVLKQRVNKKTVLKKQKQHIGDAQKQLGMSPINKSVSILHPHPNKIHPSSSYNATQLTSSPLTSLKISIPKLKLDILPNYHKKGEKSMNESLMAAYQEKHQRKLL